MARTMEVSPYITKSLRKLGKIYELSEEERNAVIFGAEEFTCELRNTDGAPLDKRVHLRRFFELLREQLLICAGDLSKALEAVDYDCTPEEQEHWEVCAKAEIQHTAYCRVMAPKGSGW